MFDDDPGNCNVRFTHFPDADSVIVDTQHVPGAPELLREVHVIADFKR